MSWSFNVSGNAEEAERQIASMLEQQKAYQTEGRFPVLEAAAAYLRAVIASAPVGSTFSMSFGGHFHERTVGEAREYILQSPWQSISISPPV